MSVNSYDNYDFITNFAPVGDSMIYKAMSGYDEKYVADIPQLSAKGMLTGTATRVPGDQCATGTVLLSRRNRSNGNCKAQQKP